MRIGGYDIFDEPEKAKRLIGYLPEQPPLYLNETPLEYLRFVGEAKGVRGEALNRRSGMPWSVPALKRCAAAGSRPFPKAISSGWALRRRCSADRRSHSG